MKKILIVDDDKKTAATLSIRLKASGYETLTAADGLEGLKLALSSRPDLIIMDIWMPGGVGVLIAERLKRVGLAHVPVIFLTASKAKEVWRIAAETDPARVLEKPCDPPQLLEAVQQVLAQASSSLPGINRRP